MIVKQISVFLENSPGHLRKVCKILADANVNIITATIAETQNFGVFRTIVDKPDAAAKALRESRIMFKEIDVVAVRLPHEVGRLQKTLEKAEEAGLNVEYMYGLNLDEKGVPVVIMKFSDPLKAEALLCS